MNPTPPHEIPRTYNTVTERRKMTAGEITAVIAATVIGVLLVSLCFGCCLLPSASALLDSVWAPN